MTTGLIAVSHPGCLGDAMYAWPLARYLAQTRGVKVDFLTSDYCRRLERLCRYQSWCHDFIVPPEYVLESLGQGGQPVDMPVPDGKYDAVYHCGFRRVPDIPIHSFIAQELGFTAPMDIMYDCPDVCPVDPPYILLGAKGITTFSDTLAEFTRQSKIPVVEIGSKDQLCGGTVIDITGLDFLETTSLFRKARAFVGLLSSQWVLSAGFNIPRIGVHNGHSWNTGVGPQTPYNLYPANPTPEQLVAMTEFLEPVCRTLHPDDLRRLHAEAISVDEMTGHLGGTFYPYHPMRRWEYGLTLQVLKRHGGIKTVLDVGGAASILAPLVAATPTVRDEAIRIGADVIIVDPCSPHEQFPGWVEEQSRRIGKPLPLVKQDFMSWGAGPIFDAVVCISVIEHVPNDIDFFNHLLKHVKPGGVLVITCDFFPDAVPRAGQCRAYTRERMEILKGIAYSKGFTTFDRREPDWRYRGNYVESYSFASLVLKRKL